MRTLLAMPSGLPAKLFTQPQLGRLAELTELATQAPVEDFDDCDDALLAEVEVLVTGWGSPRVDASALARMPRLRAVVHTAGTVRSLISPEVWDRDGIVVTSTTEANAIPVAEYTLAQVLLAGKRTLELESIHRQRRAVHNPWAQGRGGNYGSVVGLIGASRIGQLVAEHLRHFDVEVLISDPYVGEEEIAALGAAKVELPELFSRSDVVSLHAPDLPATKGMVSAGLLALMRDGTTFINTARPALVDLDALRAEVVSGRISAVLDVHDDLAADDPIWDVETVTITPHIAGSQGNELHRLGDFALEELRRLGAGEPPRYPVDRTRLRITA
ncbi:hydroxyacid dehydrogenase [Tessaracoccus sp. OS52]|uniref:hydroxyacid dehydrogenase n=1 Tax=Tessaracoccus sp. OS52 TaxID=2886691 RepID=UPI001D10514D|nr:hydroxyacid dehydrogenase [Tessaracoccus sp. OS52]MCC2594047.1 hydroxyacid dehydrogenase [Tessaracoccus sp. OS52]